MPTTKELLQARLLTIRLPLLKAIGRVSPDMAGWALAPGMRTIGGMLIEIAGCELQARSVMEGNRAPTDEEILKMIGNEDLRTLIEFLETVRRDTLAYLNGLTEEQLNDDILFPEGWQERLGLPSVPLSEGFRSMAMHEAYHTGQLFSYLWARGDNPYQW